MVPFSMTFNGPLPKFQGHDILNVKNSKMVQDRVQYILTTAGQYKVVLVYDLSRGIIFNNLYDLEWLANILVHASDDRRWA